MKHKIFSVRKFGSIMLVLVIVIALGWNVVEPAHAMGNAENPSITVKLKNLDDSIETLAFHVYQVASVGIEGEYIVNAPFEGYFGESIPRIPSSASGRIQMAEELLEFAPAQADISLVMEYYMDKRMKGTVNAMEGLYLIALDEENSSPIRIAPWVVAIPNELGEYAVISNPKSEDFADEETDEETPSHGDHEVETTTPEETQTTPEETQPTTPEETSPTSPTRPGDFDDDGGDGDDGDHGDNENGTTGNDFSDSSSEENESTTGRPDSPTPILGINDYSSLIGAICFYVGILVIIGAVWFMIKNKGKSNK